MHIRNKEIQAYIGKRIFERRKKLGLTLVDVAANIGIVAQQIQKYERAHSNISASTLYALSSALGVDLSYFFDGFHEFEKMKRPLQHTTIAHDRRSVLNILLIEDDAGDAYLTRLAFQRSSIAVNILVLHEMSDVFAFLRKQRTTLHFPRPDVIMLDLNLPKQNGFSILRDLKQDRTLSDIPVVIITNNISIKDMVACYHAYAAGYICKPFDFDVFAQKLDALARYWSQTVVLPNRQQAQ